VRARREYVEGQTSYFLGYFHGGRSLMDPLPPDAEICFAAKASVNLWYKEHGFPGVDRSGDDELVETVCASVKAGILEHQKKYGRKKGGA
jgi:hypothetical protein